MNRRARRTDGHSAQRGTGKFLFFTGKKDFFGNRIKKKSRRSAAFCSLEAEAEGKKPGKASAAGKSKKQEISEENFAEIAKLS